MTCGNESKRLDEHLSDPNGAVFGIIDSKIKVIGRVLCNLFKLKDLERIYISKCKRDMEKIV